MDKEDKKGQQQAAAQTPPEAEKAPEQQAVPEGPQPPEEGKDNGGAEEDKEKSFQERLLKVVGEFPEFGDVLEGVMKGMSPQEAFARYMDLDSMEPPEGAPDYEKIGKAREERQKALGEKKSREEARKKELTGNEQVSIENVRKFQAEKGWDEKTTIEFLDKISALNADMFDGKLTPEHLAVLEKGFNYDKMASQKDKEAQAAAEDAHVAGLNEQIEKKRAGKDNGDGLPRLSNTGAVKQAPKKKLFLAPREEFRV